MKNKLERLKNAIDDYEHAMSRDEMREDLERVRRIALEIAEDAIKKHEELRHG